MEVEVEGGGRSGAGSEEDAAAHVADGSVTVSAGPPATHRVSEMALLAPLTLAPFPLLFAPLLLVVLLAPAEGARALVDKRSRGAGEGRGEGAAEEFSRFSLLKLTLTLLLLLLLSGEAEGEEEGSVLASLRRIVEFQWFLIALSVRPGRSLAISAHLLPSCLCASISMLSSSSDHASFLIEGLRWLCHRSRHCLPILPCWRAIKDQNNLKWTSINK